MRVFLSVASFSPSYGGPARSVSRLALALAERDFEIVLWAPDGSATSSPLVSSHANVEPRNGPLRDLFGTASGIDLIHDSGIWLPYNHELAAISRKQGLARIVSPRGTLEPWAMQHKAWKKRLAWSLYQRRDLETADALHATSKQEAENLARFGWKTPLLCLPNGVDVPNLSKENREGSEKRNALFVGRIYPVKGLPMLVEAWAKVRPSSWRMTMVGPDEAGHRREVEELIRDRRLEGDFEFTGPLSGDALQKAYESADLFVLPSHTENFGMVAAEALAHGLPVIATHGTPWEILETEGCGWWVPTSVKGIAAALEKATSLSPQTLLGMGEKGRTLVKERFSWEKIADGFIKAYRGVV